jgi:hypothetical protein
LAHTFHTSIRARNILFFLMSRRRNPWEYPLFLFLPIISSYLLIGCKRSHHWILRVRKYIFFDMKTVFHLKYTFLTVFYYISAI